MPTSQIHITKKKRSILHEIKSDFPLRLAFWNDARVVANNLIIICGVREKVYLQDLLRKMEKLLSIGVVLR